jgi:hypothetical protein
MSEHKQDPMLKRKRGVILWRIVLLIIATGVLFIITWRPSTIPNWLFPASVQESERFRRFQPAEKIKAISHVPISQHPYMAGNTGNNMHNDAAMSDTYEARGPLGLNPKISSRSQGFGGYGTIAFDSGGRLVAVFSNARNFQLELMDAHTLEELASYDLPPRSLDFLIQGVMPWEYIGAGMYFYLDNENRAIVPTTGNTVQVIQVPEQGSQDEFQLVKEYDLAAHVVPLSWPDKDSVAWVLPDWQGAYYWYATTSGMVGTIHVDSGEVYSTKLAGEIIENSIAIGPDGVFIISDQALYLFRQNGDGVIETVWRITYDPGPDKKPGVITRGSGTSVTLLGDEDGFVVVTDNAEPQIHLLFIRREDGHEECRIPLFHEKQSATDITVIGFEQADDAGNATGRYSVIAENNWGHSTFPFARPTPGITRVDLFRQKDGSYTCEEVWTSEEINIGVFKLSLGSGLLYTYFRGESLYRTAWYFTAIDFATGETVYKALTGAGMGYNNWAGAIFLHPDGGIAYSTTIFGLVRMQDMEP